MTNTPHAANRMPAVDPLDDLVDKYQISYSEAYARLGMDPEDDQPAATSAEPAVNTAPVAATSTTPAKTPAPRYHGPYNEGSDSDLDPEWNGGHQPTAEERLQAALPDSPGRLAALAMAGAIADRDQDRITELLQSDQLQLPPDGTQTGHGRHAA